MTLNGLVGFAVHTSAARIPWTTLAFLAVAALPTATVAQPPLVPTCQSPQGSLVTKWVDETVSGTKVSGTAKGPDGRPLVWFAGELADGQLRGTFTTPAGHIGSWEWEGPCSTRRSRWQSQPARRCCSCGGYAFDRATHAG
jgi:hypothetical protein